MTEEEETACSIFLKDTNEQETADCDEEDLGYAVSALRNSHQAKRARVGVSAYRAVRRNTPTTAIVERLFRKAKHIMTASRRKVDPSSLNMLVFLKANRNL